MFHVVLPPEIQLRPGETLVRQASSALESKWYFALVLGNLAIGLAMDFLIKIAMTTQRIDGPSFFATRFFAIPFAAFLLMRIIWKSRYYLTTQRVMALSGPNWAGPTLHEMPVEGCSCRWFNRFGLTVLSPGNGVMRLAFLGFTDANGFAYDINQLGQVSARAPKFTTGTQT